MANGSLMSKLWRYYTTLLDWQFGCKNFAISDYHCTKLHKKCRVANLLRSLTANNLSSSKEAGEALTTAIAAVADTRKMTRSNITIFRSELIKLWVASTRTVNLMFYKWKWAVLAQVQLQHKSSWEMRTITSAVQAKNTLCGCSKRFCINHLR